MIDLDGDSSSDTMGVRNPVQLAGQRQYEFSLD
jgi:hypothetical protein